MMHRERAERPRLFRRPGFRLNPVRDPFLLEIIGKGVLVRQDLVEAMAFAGSRNPRDLADDRLGKMARAGLARPFQVPSDTGERRVARHWALTRGGVELARTLGVRGADLFRAVARLPYHDVAHYGAVNHVRFALAREAAACGARLAEFLTDAQIRRRYGRAAALARLVPDGLFTVEAGDVERSAAVEVDFRGEPRSVLARKGALYAHGMRIGSVHGFRLTTVIFLFARPRRLAGLAPILASLRRQSFLVGLSASTSGSLKLPQVAWAEHPTAFGPLWDLAKLPSRTSPAPEEVEAGQLRGTSSDSGKVAVGVLR